MVPVGHKPLVSQPLHRAFEQIAVLEAASSQHDLYYSGLMGDRHNHLYKRVMEFGCNFSDGVLEGFRSALHSPPKSPNAGGL